MTFIKWLEERNDNIKYNKDIISRFTRYVKPFYNNKEITTWSRNEHQRLWLKTLIDKNLSVSTIESCKNAANMFLKYKAETSDGEIKYANIKLLLPSLTTKRRYKIETERKSKMKKTDVERIEGQFINNVDINIILENSTGYLYSLIWMSYHYGLRLAECIAVDPANYRNNYLLVKEQAASKHKNKYLKGVLARKVPHFNLSIQIKKKTLLILKEIPYNRVNPTSVNREYKKLMNTLNMNYRFHDLRATWITNLSLEGVNAELIRQAAGHTDMSTTQRYLRDPHVSEFGDRVFGE